VRLGQNATITSDNGAFATEFRGTVTEIGRKIGKKDVLNTDPAADVDARVIEVKIALTPEDSAKVAGLTYAKVVVEINN
jgi:HlyD family secretion protein